jgi:thiamine transport system substrate-binding protein
MTNQSTRLSPAARAPRVLALTGAAALALTACSLGGSGGSDPTSGSTSGSAAVEAGRCTGDGALTVLTHESFVLPDEAKAAFEKESGCTLKLVTAGDAGLLTNRLVLTKGSPVADAVFGIDNTFAGRAVAEGVLDEYQPELPAGAADHALPGEGAKVLVPVDFGDVCVNIDDTWFAKKKVDPPATLDDLTKREYKDLFVTPGASSSSPGLSFLLATVAAKGEDGWQQYWRDLMANGTKITSGWSDAYGVDFTAGEGQGDRPVVLSYASSPPFTVPEGGTEPTTSALLDTCFRQVEYAGVVKGTEQPAGARAFVDLMLSDEVQAGIPESMYMYPASSAVELPQEWARWAKTAEQPLTVDPARIEEQRATWLREWTDITS